MALYKRRKVDRFYRQQETAEKLEQKKEKFYQKSFKLD